MDNSSIVKTIPVWNKDCVNYNKETCLCGLQTLQGCAVECEGFQPIKKGIKHHAKSWKNSLSWCSVGLVMILLTEAFKW